MERFRPALRRVAGELDLPRRPRTALLLEMAADLEAVYEHHRSRGLSEEEAGRLAEATVLGSSEVIRRLGRLHGGTWRDWAEEVSGRLSEGLHLILWVAGVLPVIALAGGVSVWVLRASASIFVWCVLLAGLMMATLAAIEAARLLRGRPLRRRSLPSLLVLAAMAPALGLLALIFGVQRVIAGSAGAAPGHLALVATIVRDGATLMAGLLVGIGGLMAWLVLLAFEARRAEQELGALLNDGRRAHHGSGSTLDAGDVIPLVRRRHG